MIVCPVCEHQQAQGAECEVCGKRLVAGVSAADLAIPAVEGLEPTLHAPAGAGGGGELVAELEPTLHDPAAARAPVPADPTPDMEATRTAPVDVAVELTPDLERTAAQLPDDAPTALPAFATCRYCRTPAMPGERLCSRCGMRLPVVAGASGPAAVAPVAICSCGMVLREGASLCPSCGARHR
jgi:hypothetical protein